MTLIEAKQIIEDDDDYDKRQLKESVKGIRGKYGDMDYLTITEGERYGGEEEEEAEEEEEEEEE
jgi:hypothetical protein